MGSQMLVNPIELRNSANKLRQSVNRMQDILTNATNLINGTAETYKSDAADALRFLYNSFKKVYEDFFGAITKYATFLDNTATAYAGADKTISAKAEELLNSGYNA